MPALLLLASALGLNYHRHRHGRSTICSTCRQYVGPRAMTAAVLAVVGWFIPHYSRPFIIRATALVDDALATFDTEETP
jgi:hypothetical protein